MAQKIIKGPVDDNSLNSTNHNFTELYNMKNVLQTQINDLVLDAGESNQEVAQARNGERTLADRLNKSEAKLVEVDRDKISRGNVQKHDYDLSKDKNLWNINDLDEETRKAILGNQNIDINYILGKDSVKNENISKNAVEEKNISFITNGENLFNGKYVNASVQGDMNNPGNFVVNENYRCVIVPVNPDRKYTVMKEEGVTNRFRIASFEKYPENGERVGRFIKDAYTPSSKHPTNDDYSYYTFNTTENDRYVVVSVSIEKATPKVMVSEGDVPEDYEEYKLVFKENVTFDKRLELPNERMDVFGTFNASLISEKESFVVDFKNKKVITSSDGGFVVVNGKKGIIDDFAIDIPLNKTNGLWIALEKTGSVWRVFFLTNNELEVIDYRKYGIIGNIRLDEEEVYIIGSSYKVIKSGMITGSCYRFINSDDFSDYEPTEDFINMEKTNDTDYVYNIFDSMMDENPNYVTKEEEGESFNGNPIYSYRFSMPGVKRSNVSKPKILIINAIHGHEKNAHFGTFKFFRDLCNYWNNQNSLLFLKSNIEFVLVPIANPDGYKNYILGQGESQEEEIKGRHNGNGVDINRNFPSGWQELEEGSFSYGGPKPLSEPETNIIYNLLINENPLISISVHDDGTFKKLRNVMGIGYGNDMLENLIANFGQKQDARLRKKYTEIKNYPLNLFDDRNGVVSGGLDNEAHNHGVFGILTEMTRGLSSYEDSSIEKTQKINADNLGNLILSSIRYILK